MSMWVSERSSMTNASEKSHEVLFDALRGYGLWQRMRVGNSAGRLTSVHRGRGVRIYRRTRCDRSPPLVELA